MSRALLEDGEISRRLAALDGWTREGDRIRRSFRFADFSEAFGFMARAALAAEALDHHPDWRNVWNRVDVTLTTHRASDGGSGLTDLDFELATQMDALASSRS